MTTRKRAPASANKAGPTQGTSPAAKTRASPRRRRLSAEEARESILGATEKRLREQGPDALRLQEIAADVGVSHPTVLHHFGSREQLVQAVAHRALLKLETDLLACFTQDVAPTELASTLHQIDEVLRGSGQARLVAWLVLTQAGEGAARGSRLGEVTAVLHEVRGQQGQTASFEDTAFGVALASAALFGMSLLGEGIFRAIGLPPGEETQRRFREWFSALLEEHAQHLTPAP